MSCSKFLIFQEWTNQAEGCSIILFIQFYRNELTKPVAVQKFY